MTKPSRDDPVKQDLPDEDALLDEALEESFPASDPIAVHPERERRDEDKKQ
ncbi:hypothetical protein [Caballeronia sp. LZ043]|uniref:hypothetical protein n=1 Tax=Caballeronia sp. LZ043 TaxID=3038569 RepID=UPI0028550120|nr:hypothetical protein [Caballeronia sp. LZ043]MDR5825353.1 hypothetical protein [Caballeronia sp. LZ043]